MWKCCLFLLLFVVGCGQNGSVLENAAALEQRAEKSDNDLTKLLSGAKKIKADVENSKKSLKEQLVKCEEISAKVDALLGVKPNPQPVVPSPVPSPVPIPVPVPPVVPGPSPSPGPSEPVDGRFAVAKSVYRIAMAVNSPAKKEEAHSLAEAFESVASKAAAGGLNGSVLNPQWRVISIELSKANKVIIEKNFAAWDGPAGQLGKAISRIYMEGKLDTNQDWSDLLNEIAKGLRGVQ